MLSAGLNTVCSQPDFHSASTAWLVAVFLGVFCSSSISVVHLRPWTHPQYSLSQVTSGRKEEMALSWTREGLNWCWKKILHSKVYKALAQATQGSGAITIPGFYCL